MASIVMTSVFMCVAEGFETVNHTLNTTLNKQYTATKVHLLDCIVTDEDGFVTDRGLAGCCVRTVGLYPTKLLIQFCESCAATVNIVRPPHRFQIPALNLCYPWMGFYEMSIYIRSHIFRVSQLYGSTWLY